MRRPAALGASSPTAASSVLALVWVVVAWVVWGPTAPALAVPDSGAGQDTPGTSVTVSPRTLSVGGTIRFRVTGFPAGEVVYVKIDDGTFCSASSVHGACVVHQQRLDAHGAASGSIVLPSDVATGKHWLRFLASQEVAGGGGGVKGYTARGDSDFTVTRASASSGATGGTTSGTTGGAASGASAAADPDSPTGSSTGSSTAGAIPAPGATLTPDLPRSVATVTVTAGPVEGAGTGTVAEEAAASRSTTAGGRPPYVGIGGLVVLVALAALLVARRPGRDGA